MGSESKESVDGLAADLVAVMAERDQLRALLRQVREVLTNPPCGFVTLRAVDAAVALIDCRCVVMTPPGSQVGLQLSGGCPVHGQPEPDDD